jgi:hypothetical protein
MKFVESAILVTGGWTIGSTDFCLTAPSAIKLERSPSLSNTPALGVDVADVTFVSPEGFGAGVLSDMLDFSGSLASSPLLRRAATGFEALGTILKPTEGPVYLLNALVAAVEGLTGDGVMGEVPMAGFAVPRTEDAPKVGVDVPIFVAGGDEGLEVANTETERFVADDVLKNGELAGIASLPNAPVAGFTKLMLEVLSCPNAPAGE